MAVRRAAEFTHVGCRMIALVSLDQIVERLLVSRLLFPELFNPSLRGRRESIWRRLLRLFLRIGKQIFSFYQSYRHLYHRSSEIRQSAEQAQCQRLPLFPIFEIRVELTISDTKEKRHNRPLLVEQI